MTVSCTGCTTWDNFKAAFIDQPLEEDTSVRIGILEPQTGADAAGAHEELTGIEIAHAAYPTVDGKNVELVYADNGSSVELCSDAAKSLIEAGVSVILGSYNSVLTLASSDVIREAKIPAIAITNTNPIVTKTNPYYFRVSFIDSFEGTVAAKFVYEQLQTTSVAILLKDGNDYGKAIATDFISAFEEASGEYDIVDTLTVPAETTDYGQYFVNLHYLSPSAIFFPTSIAEAEKVITESKMQGYNFTWVGTSKWDGLQEDNVYYTLDYDPNKATSAYAAILDRGYKNKFGQDKQPSDAVALGFDAYMFALKGIQTAEGESGNAIRRALESVENMQCATGYLTMSSSGDPIKEFVVEKYEDGERAVVYTMLPQKEGRDEEEEGELQ